MSARHYLLVDDNVAFAENVAEILRDEGAVVSISTSGLEALEHVRRTRFDAVITDMRMPVMGGAELVHELRLIDPDVPAIVITAHIQEADLAVARGEGVLAVLPKPVPIRQLQALVLAGRRGGLVVVIEDDPHLADNLAELLRGRGFSAVVARTVAEVERLMGVHPFVALVDLRLPDGPRGEVLERLARHFPALGVVVVTGCPEALPPGGPERVVFTKPFDSEKLLAELERRYGEARR
ncbi:MAG: response regulator [Archangium sp.]|nr:response regulator [Archangium sp.]